MVEESTNWWVTGASVRGASHERSRLPNQDAWRSRSSPDGRQVVIAVADGHGSARSFRSDVGARLAVAAAICKGWSFLEAHSDDDVRPDDKQWQDLELALDSLATHILFCWDEKVRERSRDQDEQGGQEPEAALAYGTTLLVVLATASFLGFLQLGDGDILAVSADGTVERAIARDQRFIGNQTASLAMSDAAKQFRSRCWPFRKDLPALVLLSTDGYANSYSDEDAFQDVAASYFRQIRDDGVEAVRGRLRSWLGEVTAGGSGDDVTVGLLVRDRVQTGSPGGEADLGQEPQP